MPKAAPEPEEGSDAFEGFTPDALMDGIAERLWKKIGEKPEGDDAGEESEPILEKAPVSISKGARFGKWWFGEAS